MSCCPDCGNNIESEFGYLYRQKKGESVFTGFVLKDNDADKTYWIGKDEKTKPRHINFMNIKDCQFYMKQMRQYD